MISSRRFRFELVGITMLISAVSLVLFGAVSWTVIRSEKQSRIDLRLENSASRFGVEIFAKAHPPHPGMPIMQVTEEFQLSPIAMAVVHERTGFKWTNTDWPKDIDPNQFKDLAIKVSRNPHLRNDDEDGGRPQTGPPRTGPGRGIGPPPQNPPFNRNLRPAEGMIDASKAEFKTLESNEESFRLLIVPADRSVLLFGLHQSQIDREMAETTRAFLLALPFAVFLSGAGAFALAGRAIQPVKRLTKSAQNISASDLDQRLSLEGEPIEFSELIKTYNQMLERLKKSFEQAKRFSADAAHELNTPLTILTGHLDEAIQQSEPGSVEQERFVHLMEEVSILSNIIEKLLLLSRADSGRLVLGQKEFNLSNLLKDVSDDAKDLTDQLSFTTSIENELFVTGDEALLRQVFFNLATNAIKYNRKGGFVSIVGKKSKDAFVISFTNTGNPIPDEQVHRLFDRFFRVDDSRNRSQQGLGLGLSLAQEIIHVHQGTLQLSENLLDRITFEVRLPKTKKGAV